MSQRSALLLISLLVVSDYNCTHADNTSRADRAGVMASGMSCDWMLMATENDQQECVIFHDESGERRMWYECEDVCISSLFFNASV